MFEFLKRRKTDPKARLREVLGDYTLPSFPGTVTTVLRSLRDPESSAGSIAKTLSLDPGLTMELLRIANSPVFSPSRKIENLVQAIALVGTAQLESLVLSVAVKDSFPQGSSFFDYRRFWRIAMKRGIVAKEIAEILCPTRMSECFTAGFLQDMALPFLVYNRPVDYKPVLEQWYRENSDLAALERTRFSWDHAEVASWICSEWALPEYIASAIGGHHGTRDGMDDAPPPVALVAYLVENEEEDGTDKLVSAANTRYGIPEDRITKIVESSVAAADDLAGLMI
ncbi:MAG: HDOD domain-containing protein [Acidobacteria bacterium]|nr:HDOD domain-containing protein [Acidobacteriota bacterium]